MQARDDGLRFPAGASADQAVDSTPVNPARDGRHSASAASVSPGHASARSFPLLYGDRR